MRNRLTGSIFAIVAVLAFSPALLAQTPAPPRSGGAKSTPDLSGVWYADGLVSLAPDAGAETVAKEIAAGRIPRFGFSVGEPPMQPWAAERYKASREGMSSNERGKHDGDPILYPYCLPQGFPRVYTISAFEIVHVPAGVYMLFESNHQVHRIFTDGQKHLEDWGPSFMGTSHGRWDGDTLIAETGDIQSVDGFAWLDYFGHPFSDALHVTERIRRTAHDTLQIDLTFDDPKAYTKPWTGRKVFRLRPGWDITENIVCEDHQREDLTRISFLNDRRQPSGDLQRQY